MMDGEYCHEMIRARLRLAGTSFSDIARELNITPASVSLVSQGRRRSKKVAWVIAVKLGTTPNQIWPTFYKKEAVMKI
jgi:Ner family transcriptional regulator